MNILNAENALDNPNSAYDTFVDLWTLNANMVQYLFLEFSRFLLVCFCSEIPSQLSTQYVLFDYRIVYQ